MNRDDLIGLAESAVLASGLYAFFVYLLFVFSSYPPSGILLILAFSVVATILLASLCLPKFPLATSSTRPERILSYVSYQLRRKGFRVEEGPGFVTIRLGSTVAVRMHAHASLSGSRVSYQAFATPAGWGTLVTLIVIPEAAPAGIAAILYAFRKSRRFARGILIPFVKDAESAPPPSAADETRALLISGLSEGHRLAAEAYEALRSAYGDSLALAAVSAFVVWAAVFAVLVLVPALPPPLEGWSIAMVLAVCAGITTALVLYVVLRSGIRSQLLRCRSWSGRLSEALSREAIRAPPEPTEPSTVELLLEASGQIPGWLETRRRAGLSANQAMDWIVFVVSLAALGTIFYGADQILGGTLVNGLLGVLAGVGLSLGAYGLWARWKRRREEGIARTQEEWRRRIEALQSRLNGFLQEL